MLEIIHDNIYTIVGAAILALGAVRFYYGPEAWREVPWAPIRKAVIPIAHTIAKRNLGDQYYASYEVGRSEHVTTFETRSVDDVVAQLESAGYLHEPLASYKTDWTGRTESASLARHHGSKPFPGAPEWLRERQTHVTLFGTVAGGTVVTAHTEYNSWRPDLAEKHYRGIGMDIAEGVERAAMDLNLVEVEAAGIEIDAE